MLLLFDVILIVLGSNIESNLLAMHNEDLVDALCSADANTSATAFNGSGSLDVDPYRTNSHGGRECEGYWRKEQETMSTGMFVVALLEIGILLIFMGEQLLMIAALQHAYLQQCVSYQRTPTWGCPQGVQYSSGLEMTLQSTANAQGDPFY
jgi:hypothetical protein